MDTQSLFDKTVDIPRRAPLRGDREAQVAVIGAGLAGVLIAHRLQKAGVHAVVLEAGRVGGGQTKNSTAKITSQHGVLYDALIRGFGREKARMYAQANQSAIAAYADVIREKRIDCDFRPAEAYLYSAASDEPLRREAQAAASLGIDVRFTTDTELPFPVRGAVCFAGQACFHPLAFLRALCEGLEIYEDTPALRVEGGRVDTPGGAVRARAVVFATHYPFINVPGWYFMRMHQERSYVLALQCGWQPRGMYLGIDADGLSFRSARGALLLGGGNHRAGENSAGGQYARLRERANALFPGCREIARWSAQDCVTLDGVPYIGPYASASPRWYVATGFAKWGMSTSMVSALLIAGLIMGNAPPWAEVFSPARFKLSASAQNLATETAQSVKGLVREAFAPPRAVLDALAPGHGGIVQTEGGKAGVYKDMEGRCHIVDARCPHLGCQLEWNPDERSWDCPCHGSRFTYDGALLDNPAQEGLTTRTEDLKGR